MWKSLSWVVIYFTYLPHHAKLQVVNGFFNTFLVTLNAHWAKAFTGWIVNVYLGQTCSRLIFMSTSTEKCTQVYELSTSIINEHYWSWFKESKHSHWSMFANITYIIMLYPVPLSHWPFLILRPRCSQERQVGLVQSCSEWGDRCFIHPWSCLILICASLWSIFSRHC